MPKEDPFVNRAQLLKAIKKYPEIWDSNNKLHMCRSVTAPMWNEIAEQFGGHVPTVKLQSIWSQMKYHYHNLVHRQILHKERFTTKWEHFEPMSFMYNITVAKIVGAANNGNEAQQAPAAISPQMVTSSPPPLPQPQTQGRGRPSGNFSWLPVAPPQNEISVETTPYVGFTGLVPPAVITVEATTTPAPPAPVRKPGRPGSLNNSMRGRIIDMIKAHPILWAGRQPRTERVAGQAQNRTSAVWKEVAFELGLTPSLVQTRWSIIKQRYVDELQKERHALYSQHGFQSSWEHFERMSFMREILMKKVDEREQTREHIQEIVSEQQQQQHQQQLQTQQHMRYAARSNGALVLAPGPPGLVAGMPPLAVCSDSVMSHDMGVPSMSGAGLMPPPMLHGATGHNALGRRRVKAESDLEWDPFEMILHVQANEAVPHN